MHYESSGMKRFFIMLFKETYEKSAPSLLYCFPTIFCFLFASFTIFSVRSDLYHIACFGISTYFLQLVFVYGSETT